MGENSKIQWTDHTMNFWIGCTPVSGACDHCYAQTLSERYGWAEWGVGKPRHRTSPGNWSKPLAWNHKAAKLGIRYRVFSNSLSDFFDKEVPDAWRNDAMKVIEAARMDGSAWRAGGVAWLIESPGPKYLGIFEYNRTFLWTADHMKAMRFARFRDAADAMTIVQTHQPDLFYNGLWERTTPVEHMWPEQFRTPARTPSPALPGERDAAAKAYDSCADMARTYSENYPQSSDGRNTFVLLAEWCDQSAALERRRAALKETDNDLQPKSTTLAAIRMADKIEEFEVKHSAESEREAFEKWAASNTDDWAWGERELAWTAWQARAAHPTAGDARVREALTEAEREGAQLLTARLRVLGSILTAVDIDDKQTMRAAADLLDRLTPTAADSGETDRVTGDGEKETAK